jgi:hypothetical protein
MELFALHDHQSGRQGVPDAGRRGSRRRAAVQGEFWLVESRVRADPPPAYYADSGWDETHFRVAIFLGARGGKVIEHFGIPDGSGKGGQTLGANGM